MRAVWVITEDEIDAGAQALRDRQMAGRITRPWEKVPKSERRKWRDHACVVLAAAQRVIAAKADKGTTT